MLLTFNLVDLTSQNPYVLCRLFKKQDESLEASNGDDVDRTASTPMTANYSPDEIQSDSALVPASSSQVTEDDKPLPVISENSEEAISNIITPGDIHSDECDAPDAQYQIVEPVAEVRLADLVSIYDCIVPFSCFNSPPNLISKH